MMAIVLVGSLAILIGIFTVAAIIYDTISRNKDEVREDI